MLMEIIRKRCSVRSFSTKEIPSEIVETILEAGRLSPSGGNEQAWKFGVITDKTLIESIAEAAYKQNWILTSSLLIVLCATIVEEENGGMDIQNSRFPSLTSAVDSMDRYLYAALNLEEHQTKIPGTHMILQAMEHGIYSTWISYFDVEKVARLLELPEGVIPSEIIAFGYPAAEPVPKKKKTIDQIVFYNKYGK